MADATRTMRDANLTAAMNDIQKVVNPPGKIKSTIMLAVAVCVALVGLLGVGNSAAKLSVHAEHEEEDKCGFTTGETVSLIQSLLIVAIGLMLARKSMS